MIVISSSNGAIGLPSAMDVLKQGGSAVDAVEAGIRVVESNENDHSVGYGGYPNLLGQVELDAALMEGTGLTSGAVGCIRNYKHPISIARKVMELLPHVFLVSHGAERFAQEMGFQHEELLTPVARESWLSRLENDLHISDTTELQNIQNLWQWVEITTDPEHAHGTTNFIALDHNGTIAASVSTSGWAWKYPGRIGDSPIIGAGLYADDRYGAVTCTGTGEMAIRACTAHSVVFYLKTGMSLEEAGESAMRDLNDLEGNYISGMNLIAMTPEGHHCGFSSREDTYYSYLSESMTIPAEGKRHYMPIKQRWRNRSNPLSLLSTTKKELL